MLFLYIMTLFPSHALSVRRIDSCHKFNWNIARRADLLRGLAMYRNDFVTAWWVHSVWEGHNGHSWLAVRFTVTYPILAIDYCTREPKKIISVIWVSGVNFPAHLVFKNLSLYVNGHPFDSPDWFPILRKIQVITSILYQSDWYEKLAQRSAARHESRS
jgi:hypothetical protein